MNLKVKIPKEVAEIIKEEWDEIDKYGLTKHLYLTNWATLSRDIGVERSNTLINYAKDNMITYVKALIEGYEIEEDKYKVNIVFKDKSTMNNCFIYRKGEKNESPVTSIEEINGLFLKMPWGNEVRRFGIASKYIQTTITPDEVLSYILVKMD